jgi:hypothetical protein
MDAGMTTNGSRPGDFGPGTHVHGPFAEEAAKFAEALAGWASSGLAASGAGEAAECRMCPFCQLLRLVQGSRPEVFEHLSDASASLLAAVRAAIESSQGSWASGKRPASERIDIH